MRPRAPVKHAGGMSGTTAPRTPWSVRGLALAAVVATAVLVPPYLVPGGETLVSRDDALLRLLLVMHVAGAGAAICLGTLQLVPRIRRRRRVHRAVGRVFLLLGSVAFVVTGLPLALTTANDVARYGLLVPVLLWPVFAVAGFAAIRRRDVTGHRRWMIRLYAVSFFAITARMVVPVLMLLQLPVLGSRYGGDVEVMVEATVPIGQWLGWIVNLTIAERVIRHGIERHGRVATETVPGTP